MTKYRVVKDRWLGFQVQEWRWWWPFWTQSGFTNTHSSLEAALRWLEGHKRNHVVWSEQ